MTTRSTPIPRVNVSEVPEMISFRCRIIVPPGPGSWISAVRVPVDVNGFNISRYDVSIEDA